MNCLEAQQNLEDYADNLLASQPASLLRDHLGSCEKCNQSLEQHQLYLTTLRQRSVPQMASGIAKRVMPVEQAESVWQHQGFWRGFAAASLMAVVLLGGIWLSTPGQYMPSLLVEIGVEVKPVDVIINAPGDMQGVTLAISLPSQLELEGYGDIRELVWNVDLKAGTNHLTLPVRLLAGAGEGEGADGNESLVINVLMSYQDMEKEFQIGVDAIPLNHDQQGGVLMDDFLLEFKV